MKVNQSTALFAQSTAIYYLSCIVWTFVFSIFYYFHMIKDPFFQYGLWLFSIISALFGSIYLIKKAEKKTLFFLLGFLTLLLIVSLTVSFSFTHLIFSISRFFFTTIISLFIFLRK